MKSDASIMSSTSVAATTQPHFGPSWPINSFCLSAIPVMTTITIPTRAPTLAHLIEVGTQALKRQRPKTPAVSTVLANGKRRSRRPSHSTDNLPGLLRRVCKKLDEDLDSPATRILGGAYEETRRRLNHLTDLDEKTRRQFRWAVKKWQVLLAEHFPFAVSAGQIPVRKQPPKLTKFAELLREAMRSKAISIAKLASQTDMTVQKLERWRGGRCLPQRSSIGDLERLATALEIDLQLLLPYVKEHRGGPSRAVDGALSASMALAGPVPKDKRLQLPRDEELPMELKGQWQRIVAEHVRMGSSSRSGSKRGGAGWEPKTLPAGQPAPPWFAAFNGGEVQTARRYWSTVRSFIAFLASTHNTAFDLSPAEAMSIGWFGVPEAVEAYAMFLIERTGGVVNGSVNGLNTLVSLLCSEGGWVRRHVGEFDLPERFRVVAWPASCDEAVLRIADIVGATPEASRDWDEFLSLYLSHADPATPVLAAIEQLWVEADARPPGSKDRARLLRDAAVLALELMLPLRTRTLSLIEYGTVARHITFSADTLKFNLPPQLLKNGRSRGAFKGAVEGELVHVLRRYVQEARPVLCAGERSPYLFVSSRHPTRPWSLVSVQVAVVTGRHCGLAIPAHLFRHVIAVRYLRQHPADYLGVASLLHDSLETVLARYAPKDPTGALLKNSGSLHLPRRHSSLQR